MTAVTWHGKRDVRNEGDILGHEPMGVALFGYSELYGSVAGGQAEYLRVPQAQNITIRVPHEHADHRYVCLSDVLPTASSAPTR